MNILDSLTFLSLVAINADILLQNLRVHRRKSSQDISLSGTVIRYTAIIIILAKYLTIHDRMLIVGQVAILLNVGIYLFLVVKYRHGNRQKGKD
jgi:hypothetical protein